MKTEMKISLSFYKIAYALFFTVVLSIVRGINFSYEIGIAAEAPMAILAAVFCADTYAQEIVSRRFEIWRLYPMKKKLAALGKRMMAQEGYLFILAAAGYGMFAIFQKPLTEEGNEAREFGEYLLAVLATLVFWGLLSHTISVLFRNMWAGISGCLILWMVCNSKFGERVFGDFNLFSYTFREVGNASDLTWLYGKALCIAGCILLAVIQPYVLKKRG